jgi:hypothetical protein
MLITEGRPLDAAGRPRSPATMPGFHSGHPPRKHGLRGAPDRTFARSRVAGNAARPRPSRPRARGWFSRSAANSSTRRQGRRRRPPLPDRARTREEGAHPPTLVARPPPRADGDLRAGRSTSRRRPLVGPAPVCKVAIAVLAVVAGGLDDPIQRHVLGDDQPAHVGASSPAATTGRGMRAPWPSRTTPSARSVLPARPPPK